MWLSLALRSPVTQAGPAACLVRGVVLEVAVPGGPPADGAGAGGVPDLGQVPQPDSRVMTPALVPVLAVAGVQGVDRDDPVRPGSRGAQPPGAMSVRRAVPVTHQVVFGLAAAASPAGLAAGVPVPSWRGRESLPRTRSRKARARSSSMPPSSPALRSSPAHERIRWSHASTSSGGSSRPIRAALPESSAHRSTRAVRAAASRRCLALPGAASITARASADRSPPGVGRPARPRTAASTAAASPSDRYWVSRTISSALARVMSPAGQRAQRRAEPGGQVPRCGQQPAGLGPGLAQRVGQLGAARRHVPRHPGPEPGGAATGLAGERPRGPGLPRSPPPRAGGVQREHLIGGGLPDPASSAAVSSSCPGGGAADPGSQYSCGASDGSSSCAHSRSSHASRSAAVIGSGRDQAGSSSHSGSGGAGTEGMNHVRSAEVLFFEHDSVFNLELPAPYDIPNRNTNVVSEVQGVRRC